MRRERAQAGLDRLLVADVGEHRSEDRHARAVGRRNSQARLRHQRQQPGGLQGDGLAAGVRARDQQDTRRRNHLDRDGNHVISRSAEASRSNHLRCTHPTHPPLLDQQRVARGLELERAIDRKRRLDGVDGFRIPRLRLHHVELGRGLDRSVDIGGPGAERVRERQQDPADLFRLLLFERRRCRC